MAITGEMVRTLKSGHWDCARCGTEIELGDFWEDAPEHEKQHIHCKKRRR